MAGAPDPATHRQADSRLHLAIASVTRSPMTIAAVTEVQSNLHDMLQAIPVLDVSIQHSNAQHTAIVDAICADPPPHRMSCDEMGRGLLAGWSSTPIAEWQATFLSAFALPR